MQIIYFTIENKIYFEAPVVDKIECYVFRRLKIIGRNPKWDHDRRKKNWKNIEKEKSK